MGAETSHLAGDYKEPDLPEGVLEVRLSVYKLEITGVGFLDHIGAGVVGAYHTGLVVDNNEWAFGGHDLAGKSGVYRTKPELNPDYIFYQRIVLGTVSSTASAVGQQIRHMARNEKWAGPAYDLVERNCNHFASDLCWMLLKKRPPDWINATAEGVGLGRRRQRTKSKALAAALSDYRKEHGSAWIEMNAFLASVPVDGKAEEKKSPDAPGAKMFADTFERTFDEKWSYGEKRIEQAVKDCAEGEDPVERRRKEETSSMAAAAEAAYAAATVVAAAARVAREARLKQPQGCAQNAWDDAWMRESSTLLQHWRQQAVEETLDPSPNGEQGLERARLLEAALAKAARRAEQAAEEERERLARRAAAKIS